MSDAAPFAPQEQFVCGMCFCVFDEPKDPLATRYWARGDKAAIRLCVDCHCRRQRSTTDCANCTLLEAQLAELRRAFDVLAGLRK